MALRQDRYVYIIRSHRSAMYVNANCCYRPSSVVCRCLCKNFNSFTKTSQNIKNACFCSLE